jgi:hypothetical protein
MGWRVRRTSQHALRVASAAALAALMVVVMVAVAPVARAQDSTRAVTRPSYRV